MVQNTGDVEVKEAITLQLTVDGAPAGTTSIPRLGANAEIAAYFDDVKLTKGTHTIQVAIDPDQKVAEVYETNNITPPQQVTCMAPADLQATKSEFNGDSGDAECVLGTRNNVRTVINNPGDVNVNEAVTVQLTIDGAPAGTTTVSGVGTIGVRSVYFDDVKLTKGAHTIQVTVDPDGTVAEADETNNTTPPQTVTCTED